MRVRGLRGEEAEGEARGDTTMINGLTKTRHKLNFLHHSFPILLPPLSCLPHFRFSPSLTCSSAAQGQPFVTIRGIHLQRTLTADHCDRLVVRLEFKGADFKKDHQENMFNCTLFSSLLLFCSNLLEHVLFCISRG